MFKIAKTWWLAVVAYALFRILRSPIFQKFRKTFSRDMRGLFLLLRIKREIKLRLIANRPLHEIWLEKVRQHPYKEAAIEVDTGRSISYGDLNGLMNKYANYFAGEGYKEGDVIAIFMENNIDFFALYLGLSKIGVVSAFINSNLKLEPLGHCINVSKCKSIITTISLLPTLERAKSEGVIARNLKTYVNNGNVENADNLENSIDGYSTSEPQKCFNLNFKSVLCYIYTSGTTGNPKPAVIKHYRYYYAAMAASEAFELGPNDRVYITMPIYHTAAGVLGVGSTIAKGTTIVIRKKFSASNFWKDAVAHNCTCSQYIGELCRYLLAQKPIPEEKQHKIRIMFGNGLRSEIWTEFTSRFGIKRIGELYGSTEGNSNIVNIDNHVGSCGFFPIYPFVSQLFPVRLVKVDKETGEVIRDKNGLAIMCKPGETGELIGIIKKESALQSFEGYVDKGDTAKKIYTNVMRKGDQAFASGDILHWDELGYLYFKDRRGDTFRWKGENVSTTEVEGIVQPVKSIIDCTVYGVEVSKHEGKAGMAALHVAEDANLQEVLEDLAVRFSANLASYAIPIFIRVCKEVEKTGTYKLKKTDLQKSGFDLSKINNDLIYFYNSAQKKYIELTSDLERQIQSGEYARI